MIVGRISQQREPEISDFQPGSDGNNALSTLLSESLQENPEKGLCYGPDTGAKPGISNRTLEAIGSAAFG